MEISPSATTVTASVKTPEAENETPSRIQTTKVSSFSNGVLKRHLPLHQYSHHHSFNSTRHPPVVVTYKECLKNHAASLGRHAVDGCGEFMPSPTATSTDPTSLKCAACGCHRNFHRREPEDPLPPPTVTPALEYQPHHRHHPPPPVAAPVNRSSGGHSSPSSPSPPPISSSYYPSAPHMLLALSAGISAPPPDTNIPMTPTAANPTGLSGNQNGRKRFRTKFTQDQKEKMQEFADRVGWRVQKRDEDLIGEFCNSIGVDKSVLKVWMHNNKNHFGRRDPSNSTPGGGTGGTSFPPASATSDHGNSHDNGNGNGNGIEFTIHYHHNLENSSDSKNGIHPHQLSHHQIHHRDNIVVTNGHGNGNGSSCS